TEAAAAGAAQATDADISALRAAYDEMVRATAIDDVVTHLDADERFLSILYRASGNPVLLETIQLLWQRCRSYKIMGAGRELDSGDPQRLLDLQQEILEAAVHRDRDRIAALTQRSIDEAMDRIRTALPT
ncbi:MAG TPA: FCD domain-containing protein, partial [Brevibacterium sp.]|nr:FCD domain-containing protein [Brevibacterium sp.]